MSDETAAFYDGLAAGYHLVYGDWHASIERQGAALDRLIGRVLGAGPARILDCSCGIGTQSLGLALRGHEVVGIDLSPVSVERARAEAAAAGLPIEFRPGDLRRLEDVTTATFDAVISCDNALPHLPSDAELRLGLRSMLARLRPGGLLLASIRDYDRLLEDRPVTTPPGVSGAPGNRRITFQVWDWQPDGRSYRLELFVMAEDGPDVWRVRVHRGGYRAILRTELEAALADEGALDITWRMPGETGFFQPIVTARRA